MNKLSYQRGVGLIEVLVAVLLLSIAVLGFSALQVRAISATDESVVRTKSLTIIRNLAEVMRAYPEAYVKNGTAPPFESILSTEFSDLTAAERAAVVSTIQAVVSSSATDSVVISYVKTNSDDTKTTISKTVSVDATGENCLSTTTKTVGGKIVPKQTCTINELAARDALMIKKQAADQGITINIETCPGSAANAIQQQMCVITAWNGTKAILDDTDAAACAGANGTYKAGSQCLISEAY
ncbi:type IV fimbrial biogenesis protein PilV [Psychrobacter sp. JCM 18902]|uniref:type IV pilus modification protein PilV n=1 Tax=Psychrobacter sp. JCM 18902 TaxID=1298607 RepID=UPI0004366B5C|nr:type IV pilus modification protein PilV [Psychrobacter sp. JCM 18902]GAF57639.1 type IV fimbrial biogenesis protein PilV [Psychrobacter sp. JCM 18902]